MYLLILFVDPPGPPTRLEPSDITKDAVTLTWCEPDDDGGSPITGYWVERLDPDTDKWVRCNKMPVKDTTFRYAPNFPHKTKFQFSLFFPLNYTKYIKFSKIT